MAMATLCPPIQFIIQDEGFRPVAHDERTNLINIGRQYKCQIEIEERSEKTCKIPKATAQDHISSKLTAAAIKIDKNDLAAQGVLRTKFERYNVCILFCIG